MRPAPCTARGPGARWLGITILSQIAVYAFLASRPPPTAPTPEPLTLGAVGVVEPLDGTAPHALDGGVLPEGARLQVTFEADRDAWVSVLWFEGEERLVPLYPDAAAGQAGWVTGGTAYVVPGTSDWLRVTPTTGSGDWLAVVAAEAPDPRIEAVLASPSREAVSALRAELMDDARARTAAGGAVERFLPTPDGRAVAVPWKRVRGHGRLVHGRWVRVADEGSPSATSRPSFPSSVRSSSSPTTSEPGARPSGRPPSREP